MVQHFISDLHLSAKRPDLIRAFVRYTEQALQQADELYIMGDWFEYWVGDDAIEKNPANTPSAKDPLAKDPLATDPLNAVFSALDNIKGHRPIYFIHGNRDFLVGPAFAERYGIILLPEVSVQTIAGQPTLLLHGDSLCTDDQAYQQFREVVRNPDWQTEFLSQSVEERQMIAEQARAMSKTDSAQKSSDIMDVNQQAVEQLMQNYNVLQMLHGHTHRPARHEFLMNNQVAVRTVLPDWDQAAFYTVAKSPGQFTNIELPLI